MSPPPSAHLFTAVARFFPLFGTRCVATDTTFSTQPVHGAADQPFRNFGLTLPVGGETTLVLGENYNRHAKDRNQQAQSDSERMDVPPDSFESRVGDQNNNRDEENCFQNFHGLLQTKSYSL